MKTIFYTVLNIKYIPLVKALQVTGKLKENQRYKPKSIFKHIEHYSFFKIDCCNYLMCS